jgi:hypothetical protein
LVTSFLIAATHSLSNHFAVNESGSIFFEDADNDTRIVEGDFIVREADAKEFLLTLGTGKILDHARSR